MSKLPPWLVGLATFLLVVFDKTFPSETDLLLVTAKPNAADFLAARCVAADTVARVDDRWVQGDPSSAPVTVITLRDHADAFVHASPPHARSLLL